MVPLGSPDAQALGLCTRAGLEFDKRTYFTMGMSKAEVEVNVKSLRTDFAMLRRCTGAPSTFLAIINKLPDALEDIKLKWTDEVNEAEFEGKTWRTDEALDAAIAYHLAKGGRKSASAAETPPVTTPTDEQAAREAAAAERERTRRGRDAKATPPCTVCASREHGYGACTKKCGKCELPFCPGARGQACVVRTTNDVPTDIKNALGDKLHSKLRRVLVKKNAEHRGIAPPSGKSASSCEANPDGEDEDYDMRMPADPEPPGPAHASTLSVALAAVERFATDVSGPRASHRVPSSMRDAELTYV